MKLKNIEQPLKSKAFFDECMITSLKSVNVQKQFMHGVHQLCKKFSEDLQHLFLLLSVQVDDEETLSQNTILSNYILSISQIIKTRSEILYEEAIEPFQQFEANYNQLNQTINREYGLVLENLKASRELLEIKALDYFEGKNKIFSQESTEQQYKMSLNQMNNVWEQFFKELPQYYEQFQLNEETRLTVTEQTYAKFIEALEYMFKQPAKITTEKLRESFENQRQKFKTRDLYQELCQNSKKMMDFMHEPKCEMFTSRDDYYRNKTAELLQDSDSGKSSGFLQEDYKTLKTLLEKPVTQLTILYKIKLLRSFNYKERDDIINFLQGELKGKNIVQLASQFQSRVFRILLLKLLKCFEEEFQTTKQSPKFSYQFLAIVQIGLTIKNEKGSSILSTISRSSDIFYTQRLWNSIYEEILTNYNLQKQMIDTTLNYVTFLQTPNSKLQLPKEIEQKGDSIFNNIFTTKTRKITQTEAINIINLILISCNLTPQNTSSVIMEIIRSNQMKPSSSIPFIELQEANQMLKEFKPQIRHQQILQKIGKGKNKSIHCFFKGLKYLDFNQNFLNLITLNRELSKVIKQKMIKYYLVSEKTKQLNLKKRVKLWSELLNIDVNYPKIQQEYLQASKKLSREIERSIMVDIKRSFSIDCEKRDQIMKTYEPKLENLLRLHAFDNPEISYYQGMNMLMVYLLFVTDLNEEQAFRLFRSLLDKMLRDIFLEGLKSMRLHFYILDRLIAIFIPKLFIHWKQLQIESPQFATAWYVTLFTHSINLSQVEGNETCFEIFDLVVARGWTGFYKATIGLLKFYEKVLIELDFDQSQKFLNNLTKTQFYRQEQNDQLIQIPCFKDVKRMNIQIKKLLISELEREYYQLREKIDQINLNNL